MSWWKGPLVVGLVWAGLRLGLIEMWMVDLGCLAGLVVLACRAVRG